jgi:hypothetical protein
MSRRQEEDDALLGKRIELVRLWYLLQQLSGSHLKRALLAAPASLLKEYQPRVSRHLVRGSLDAGHGLKGGRMRIGRGRGRWCRSLCRQWKHVRVSELEKGRLRVLQGRKLMRIEMDKVCE